MEKFFAFELEMFINESKTKTIKIRADNSNFNKISIGFDLILKQERTFEILSEINLKKWQWLKLIKKEKMLSRKINNQKEQKKKKKIFQMNDISVTVKPVQGARGLVLKNNTSSKLVELNKEEFFNLMGEKAIIKRKYNEISQKIRMKAETLIKQLETECKQNRNYKKKTGTF